MAWFIMLAVIAFVALYRYTLAKHAFGYWLETRGRQSPAWYVVWKTHRGLYWLSTMITGGPKVTVVSTRVSGKSLDELPPDVRRRVEAMQKEMAAGIEEALRNEEK